MNPAMIALLRDLLPIAMQLNSFLQGIKEKDPEVWTQITQSYDNSLRNLENAKPPVE